MQALAFIGYQLIYIQIPILIAPLPESDLLRFSWSEKEPMVGLYPYGDSVIGQFTSHEYYTRSILGEEDLFLLSQKPVSSDTPYSYIRMVSGDYKFLNLHFERDLRQGEISGGAVGLHAYTGNLLGYGNLSLPFNLRGWEGTIGLTAYSDIWSLSLNSDYFFIGTTVDKWLGYLKIGDFRIGSSYNKQFMSYLFRPIDPIFLIMVTVEGEGYIKDKNIEVTDWFIAPLYVLSLESSIYAVVSENPAVGLKAKFFDIEVGKDSYLSIKTDFLRAFITYSLDDSLPRGGVGGRVSYSFYDNKITPGIGGEYQSGELDLELSLRILETEFFFGMKDVPYGYLFWGLDLEFSF